MQEQIQTPTDYSLNIIEGIKNNAFFDVLARYLNRIYEKNDLDRSKKDLAKELVENFTFVNVRVQNNMNPSMRSQANSTMWYLLGLKEKDFESPEVLKEIARKCLDYSVLLKESGFDNLVRREASL